MPRTAGSAAASQLIGQAIRRARHAAGMTQAELAERMNASAPYISGLETGRGNPTVGQLLAVADALRVELRVEFVVPPPMSAPTIPTPPTRASGS